MHGMSKNDDGKISIPEIDTNQMPDVLYGHSLEESFQKKKNFLFFFRKKKKEKMAIDVKHVF